MSGKKVIHPENVMIKEPFNKRVLDGCKKIAEQIFKFQSENFILISDQKVICMIENGNIIFPFDVGYWGLEELLDMQRELLDNLAIVCSYVRFNLEIIKDQERKE